MSSLKAGDEAVKQLLIVIEAHHDAGERTDHGLRPSWSGGRVTEGATGSLIQNQGRCNWLGDHSVGRVGGGTNHLVRPDVATLD